MNWQNANQPNKSIAENPVFHIVITGHDLKTAIIGYSWHKEHPRAWLINLKYVTPFLREIGGIKFYIHDYPPLKNDAIYTRIINQVMHHEGLDKS